MKGVGVLKHYTSNYPSENIINLRADTSHLQHTLSDTGPTIRLDPSSTLGFTKPRRVYLRFIYMVPVLKHTLETHIEMETQNFSFNSIAYFSKSNPNYETILFCLYCL